jgi:DNA-binding PadR family transcriptional regulator
VPKRTPDARELLPLTPVVLHILLALAEREPDESMGKHGYAVAQEVETMTDGQIRMGPGTLYGSIQRMLASSLIEEVSRGKQGTRGRSSHSDEDERRRYYRLTALGHRVLELEVARLAQVVRIARAKRLLREPEPA